MYYDQPSYDEISVNVFGYVAKVGTERPPAALPLDNDELTYATELIISALAETNPNTIAAYMYGDELVAAQGHPAVGQFPYGSFQVAYHLMSDYLREKQVSVADTLSINSATFVEDWQVIKEPR